MADDLIQRLRDRHSGAMNARGYDLRLNYEAADEIERLREELAEEKQVVLYHEAKAAEYGNELAALKESPTIAATKEMITNHVVEENERLLNALRIADNNATQCLMITSKHLHTYQALLHMSDNIRYALAATKEWPGAAESRFYGQRG